MRVSRSLRSSVAAGLAAVAAVPVVGGGAWPASAGPRIMAVAVVRVAVTASRTAADAPPAATPQAGAGVPRSVVPITGDRVLAGAAPAVIRTVGAGGGGSLIQLGFAGKRYMIPSDAVPYLGHGLDMSLFDVGAVAGQQHGAVLPVRVTYSGRVPSLPGVRLTRASAGVASGYLTAASAETFGRALARQFASDRARGRFGTDGMFAGGVRIALAGATPPSAARPASPTYTLTVHGIDAAGHPDTGDGVVVANVDDPAAFGLSSKALGTFHNGTAKFSVPAGTYWASGFYNAGAIWGNGPARHGPAASSKAQMVVLPQFTVSGNTSITLDARTATSRLRLSTPLPATQVSDEFNIQRISHGGKAFLMSAVTGDSIAGGFYINPVSRPPADGTLESMTGAQLLSPASAAYPYQYYIVVKSPPGAIPAQNFHVSAGSLATIHENLYADAASATGSFNAFSFVPGRLNVPLTSELVPALRVPGRDTLYLSAVGGSAVWQSQYIQYGYSNGGQFDMGLAYRPGQVTTENWNAYPLHTAPNVNPVGPADGPLIVSANRSGDALTLDLMPFTDSTYGHLGTGYVPNRNATVSGTYQIRQNGRTIASGNALNAPGLPSGEFYTKVTLSPKPSVISFTLTAKRTGPAFPLSTATRTTWTWRSAHETGATVPKYWICSFASNHDCAPQPLPMLNYAVRGLALNGTTAPGAQALTVTVGHLQLMAPLHVTKVTVQASVNDGKTWTSATVTGSAGTYHAHFTAPPGSHVTLRVNATTTTGSKVTETITRAYATAS